MIMKQFYMLFYEDGNKAKQVYKHKVGTKQEHDVLVYQEKDDEFWVSLTKSKSKRFLFLISDSI